jgi:hypothetical protein
LYLKNLYTNKFFYLDVWILNHAERGFLQHRRVSTTHINTKNTIIIERDIIDAHNNLVEFLIGLHWCNTISEALFFTIVHFDSLCKSGYISSISWIDLLYACAMLYDPLGTNLPLFLHFSSVSSLLHVNLARICNQTRFNINL